MPREEAMSKIGEGVLKGARQALAHAKGANNSVRATKVRVPRRIDVAKVRRKLNLSQKDFAAFSGISVSTVRDWEQNRRLPRGPARVLLTIIERDPEAVERALTRD